MNIVSARSFSQKVPLTRPYTIAFSTHDDVELLFVELVSDEGVRGLGCASPSLEVTGETFEACRLALEGVCAELIGEDPRHLGRLTLQASQRLQQTPAALAAIDIALWDLFGNLSKTPLVDLLGRRHKSLPTSITIGIKSTEEALEEAKEYVGRGFRHLKIKIGKNLGEDIERVAKLYEIANGKVAIRVDANQGYSLDETIAFFEATRTLGLELIEQPLPASAVDALRSLPEDLRQVVAADESLLSERHAWDLAQAPAACGIFNIKLMKSGGVTAARSIATIAQVANIHLMWGCMDESVISIAAALHLAMASPTTRFLDLDGSFDLLKDPARGGFMLVDGELRTLEAPGLGVCWGDELSI